MYNDLDMKVNVLVAEDNLFNQQIIELFLRMKGWEYTLVGDGEEAVEEFEKNRYDVVLMDIDMPKMDGIEAARRIRIKDKLTPIVALTAYIEDSLREQSYEVGMNYFLGKPYDKEEIYATITKCLSDYQASSTL